jgi:hypothetical protein
LFQSFFAGYFVGPLAVDNTGDSPIVSASF